MVVTALARPVRVLVALAVAGLLLALSAGFAPPRVAAVGGLELTTNFPSVAVQPGSNTSFSLTLTATRAMTVDLELDGLPNGWTGGLHGGGQEISQVYVPADEEANAQLDLSIPADAADGAYAMTVNATAPDASSVLPLTVTVARAAGGTVELTTDFPMLRGASDATFSFTLQLHNNTPQQLTFSLQASGPAGWDVTAQPTGETQAASFAVDAGGTNSIDVRAVPPAAVDAGTYPIAVQAVASAGQTADAQLAVEISGRVDMTLSTSDGRLNASATAGGTGDLSIVVQNNGTAPLTGLTLSSTPPSGWQVTFEPETIDAVPANDIATAIAHITPSGDAIAGDYVVTIRAENDSASESIDIRVTVETSPLWGFIGIALIIAALGGLYWVFQRYGRR